MAQDPLRRRTRRLLATVVALAVLVLLLTACAPGVNPEIGTAPPGGNVAGFWQGLWHGFIAPVTFLISLFTDNVSLYEVHNSGNWYDLGFVLDAGILFGGAERGHREGPPEPPGRAARQWVGRGVRGWSSACGPWCPIRSWLPARSPRLNDDNGYDGS